MRRDFLILFLALVLGALALEPAGGANLRMYGAAQVSDFCDGSDYPEYDGCADASPLSIYQEPDMDNYFRDNDGNIATLAVTPGVTGRRFKVAGRDLPAGPRMAPGDTYKDPNLYSCRTTSGSTVNGTTFTVGTLHATSGPCRPGTYLFTGPAESGALTGNPIIMTCNGVGGVGDTGDTCQIFPSQSGGTKNGPYKASPNPGCYWANNSPALSRWNCDPRPPNDGETWDFTKFEWGQIGGHTGSDIRITATNSGGLPCTLVMRDNHFQVDATTERANFVNMNPGTNCNVIFEYNEYDGGNSGVAIGAPPASFPFPEGTSMFTWAGGGTIADKRSVVFRFNYIHDEASNPVQISYGNNVTITQANVFKRIGLNNGNDTANNQTGLHGATINWNTTTSGSEGIVKRYNDVAIYPYGFRFGVTTAPWAVLCGIGSAGKIDYEQRFTTSYMNASQPGYAVAQAWIDFLRCGEVTRFVATDNYSNNLGIGTCFLLGADYGEGGFSGTITPQSGQRWSQWTVSGLIDSSIQTLPYPGHAVNTMQGSSTPTWRAIFTDLLNGTSQMDISETLVGATTNLAVGSQVYSLGIIDPKLYPTLITQKLSSTSYVVSNGTGSGETLSSQVFRNGAVIQDFGAHSTTATTPPPRTNVNGTLALGGEAAMSSPFYTTATGPGNRLTLSSDVVRNYDVITGQIMTADGPSLSDGTCPNNNSIANPP